MYRILNQCTLNKQQIIIFSGWTTLNPNKIPNVNDPNEANMTLLFDAIINKISPPMIADNTQSFKMFCQTRFYNSAYL